MYGLWHKQRLFVCSLSKWISYVSLSQCVDLSIHEKITPRCILEHRVNRAIISPLLVYDYVNLGHGTVELKWLYSCPTWGKINMAIADPILADLKKSGIVLRAADDRLPALLPNLDTDTGEAECFLNKRGPCWFNNYITKLTTDFCICYSHWMAFFFFIWTCGHGSAAAG